MLGVGAIIYNENEVRINRLNDEDVRLAARIKALETAPGYSLPSSVTADIAGNCAERATIAALADPTDAATTQARVISIIAAAKVNPC